MAEILNYKGKICIVTGAATGVGKELVNKLCELGAVVYALDMYPVENAYKYINANLIYPDEIDNAVLQLPSNIDCFFNNAALPGVTYRDKEYTMEEVFRANYLAAVRLTNKLSERMHQGCAITVTTSITGEMWYTKKSLLEELFLISQDYDKAVEWINAHADMKEVFDGGRHPQPLYIFTKEALQYYVRRISYELMLKGIRINSVAPGAIETIMTDDFVKLLYRFKEFDYMEEYANAAVGPAVGRSSTAAEIADALIFMNSDLSRSICGANLNVDFGFRGAADTGVCSESGKLNI